MSDPTSTISEADARRAREAAAASTGTPIAVETLAPDIRERIKKMAGALHPLRGHAEVVDGRPLLVFKVERPLTEQTAPPRFFPWAWDGFFGAALTIALYAGDQAARVHIRPTSPVVPALRGGEFIAVLVTSSALVGVYRASFPPPVASSVLNEQLDNLATFVWPYDSPETYEIELQADTRKTWEGLEFSRDERNAMEWADWFAIVMRRELDDAEALLPRVRSADRAGLPDIVGRVAEAFASNGKLADTVPAIHKFVTSEYLGSWILAMDATSREERWTACGELAGLALRTYLQGPEATRFGRRLPFANGRTGKIDYIELDLRAIENRISFSEFWARQPPDLRFNWGLLITGSDIPVAPDIFTRSLDDLPRAENIEEVESSALGLLAEAMASKQWTIPPRACVQLKIGPFTHMELTEFEKDVGIVLRNEGGEFFIATVEPDKQYFGLHVPMLPEVDEATADAVTAAMTMLFAAVIRDFWVVEKREGVFRGVEREHVPWRTSQTEGPRVVYLPRVRYGRNMDVQRCSSELQVTARREHQVSAHLRKSHSTSAVQKALAQRYGFSVPSGYTFVRPHERGREKREVIYRSRSALRSLFAPDSEIDASTSVKWFEFERDVRSLLAALNFTVEHIAASRRGDRGVDVFARKGADLDEVCWIIQCKCWSPSRKVGPDVVRELVGALVPYPPGTRGMIVTTSGFTSGARTEAEARNIRLMDGAEFLQRVKAACD
jgi:hypothetical protein